MVPNHAEILAGDALLYKNCTPGSAMRNYFTLLAFGISTLNADRARPHDGTSCPCLAGRPPRNNRRRGLLLDDEGLPEKRAHSVRGLRALRQPRLDGGGVQVRLLFDRVVPSKLLLVKRREGERGERRVPRRLSSSSAAFHVLIRPSSFPRERAEWGAFPSRAGAARTSRGAPSRRLRESIAMMR